MPIPAILASVGGALVSGLIQGVTSSSTQPATASSTLGKDDFLRLLVAQLKNQDPLNPMDNSQFVAQTAQFSSLEQLQNMNATLAQNSEWNMLLSQTINNTMATSLIGKWVTAESSTIALRDGSVPDITFNSEGYAPQGTIIITNSAISNVQLCVKVQLLFLVPRGVACEEGRSPS